MIRHIKSDKAPPSFSNYSQAVAVPASAETIYVSGQVGVDLAGNLAQGAEGQHRQIWQNILGLLAEDNLGPHDIIEVTGYITSHDQVATFREVRESMLDGARPASTLVVVAGLASPDWLAEISVIAAKPAR